MSEQLAAALGPTQYAELQSPAQQLYPSVDRQPVSHHSNVFEKFRRWGGAIAGAATLVVAAALSPNINSGPAHASETKTAVIGMPFSGKWAYPNTVQPDANGNYDDDTSSHPSVHHRPAGGDWSTDLYATQDGQEVKLIADSSGDLSFSWGPAGGTCGESRRINVQVDSMPIGWLYFTHLSEAASTSNAPTEGMTIGKAKNILKNNKVCNPSRHVHVEFKNTQETHSCYADHGNPGASLSEGANLGVLGSSNDGVQQSCAEIPDFDSPATRLTGDVTGDGRADAVLKYNDSGNAYVGVSDGNGFAGPYTWAEGQMVGADTYFLGDVDGNGKDDLVGFWDDTGSWYASLSNGQGFWPEQPWATGHGINTSKQFIANVNSDPYDDLITFDENSGDWWVSLSDGNGFWPPQRWRQGHGMGSNDQLVADFNGDQKADAAVYFAGSGSWHVGISNGQNGFGYPSQWSSGHGMNSDKRLVGDVNGDGMADEAFFFTNNGHWDNGMSSGSGFWSPTAWAHGHGVGTTEQFLADVNSDGMADLITFDKDTGDWWVSKSSGSGFWAPQAWLLGMGKGS